MTANRVPDNLGTAPAEQERTPPTSRVPWRLDPSDDSYAARQRRHDIAGIVHARGILPLDHEVSVWVSGLAERIDPTLRVRVCRRPTYPSAEVTPDGTILVSLSFLYLIEYEEELLGVFAHERRHLDQLYAQPLERWSESDEKLSEGRAGQLGDIRLKEHDADLHGVVQYLDDRGINAYGFIRILEKISEKSTARWVSSPTHGNTNDRILSVFLLSRFVDLQHMSRENGLTPIPDPLRQAIREAPISMPSAPPFIKNSGSTGRNQTRRPTVSDGIHPALIRAKVSELFRHSRSRSIESSAELAAVINTLDDQIADQEHQEEAAVSVIAAGVYGFPVRSLRDALQESFGFACDEWIENGDGTHLKEMLHSTSKTTEEYCRSREEFFCADPETLIEGLGQWIVDRAIWRLVERDDSGDEIDSLEIDLRLRRVLSVVEAFDATFSGLYGSFGLREMPVWDTRQRIIRSFRKTFLDADWQFHPSIQVVMAKILIESGDHHTVNAFTMKRSSVPYQPQRSALQEMGTYVERSESTPRSLGQLVSETRSISSMLLRMWKLVGAIRSESSRVGVLNSENLDLFRKELVAIRKNKIYQEGAATEIQGYADQEGHHADPWSVLERLGNISSEEFDDFLGLDQAEIVSSDAKKRFHDIRTTMNAAYAVLVRTVLEAVSSDSLKDSEFRKAYMDFLDEVPLSNSMYASERGHRNFLMQREPVSLHLAAILDNASVHELLGYLACTKRTAVGWVFWDRATEAIMRAIESSDRLGDHAELLAHMADVWYAGTRPDDAHGYRCERPYREDDLEDDYDGASDDYSDSDRPPNVLWHFFSKLPKLQANGSPEDIRAAIHALRIYGHLLGSLRQSVPGMHIRMMERDARAEFFRKISFDEAYRVVRDGRDTALSRPESLHVLVEQKASTPEEIARAKALASEYAEGGINKNLFTHVGYAALSDSAFSNTVVHVTGLSRKALLKLLLKTGVDDSYLRSCLVRFAENNVSDDTFSPTQMLAMLYRLNNFQRAALLKDLALGPDGAFLDADSRREFVEWFTKRYVEDPKTDDDRLVQNVFSDILRQLANFAGAEEFFIAMFRPLEQCLLVPNDSDPDWANAIQRRVEARRHAIAQRDHMISSERSSSERGMRPEEDGDDEDGTRENELAEYERKQRGRIGTWDTDEEYRDHLRKNIVQPRTDIGLAHAADTDASIISWVGEVEKNIPGTPEDRIATKLDPSEFVVEFAQQLGSLGVRMLQVAGQYLTLPPSISSKIDTAYDQVEWQGKWSVDGTLRRHWPEYATDLLEFVRKIGGGSMNTVYMAKVAGALPGQWQAIKVANPSLLFELETVADIFRRSFTELAASDPRYAVALPILSDLCAWIVADYQSEHFLQNDERFRKKWQGFQTRKKNPYRIHIPASEGPESTKFRREEGIDGVNLTDVEAVKREGHDPEQIFELVAGHFLRQLLDGQAHSDVHVGNFRVMADRRVAILDRNFYLEFDQEDRTALRQFLQAQNKGDFVRAHSVLVDRLLRMPENSGLSSPELTNTVNKGTLEGVMLAFRNAGFHIPLRYTLLAKNLASLESMRKRFGVDRSLAGVMADSLDISTKLKLIL